MKKFVLALIATAVLLPVTAGAEILDKRQHGKWESFVLLGSETVTARMTTGGVEDPEKTLLVVNAMPDMCGKTVIQIIYCNKTFTDDDFSGTVTGSIRVDKRSVFDVEYRVSINDSCMFITPLLGGATTLFNDFKAGSFVRFKINAYPEARDSRPVYKRYSLIGFTAAHQRLLNLCRDIQTILNEPADSDYFEERKTPWHNPAPVRKQNERDADYFI